MSNRNFKNTIQEYQESSLNMNVCILFFDFHTKSSKIIKYVQKNCKIKYMQKYAL
jgi:hypothetical protein